MALNLKKSSLQRIYEYALKHVRKQGKPGMDCHGRCVYDDGGGTFCAVGAMLTPEQRAAALAEDIGSVKYGASFFEPLVGANQRKLDLLQALQAAHDAASSSFSFMDNFEWRMKQAAVKFGLTYQPPGVTLRT